MLHAVGPPRRHAEAGLLPRVVRRGRRGRLPRRPPSSPSPAIHGATGPQEVEYQLNEPLRLFRVHRVTTPSGNGPDPKSHHTTDRHRSIVAPVEPDALQHPSASPARPLRARRRTDYRRALPISLLVSLGIHALVLGASVDVDAPDAKRRSVDLTEARDPRGVRLLNLADASEQAEKISAERPREERPLRPPKDDRRPDRPAAVEPERVYDPAAALRPRLRDPRLWSIVSPDQLDLSLPETTRLRAATDSIARTRTHDVRLRVLGIPVALCSGGSDPGDCGFGILPWRRDAYRREQDLERGLKRQGARADLLDRSRMIQQRRDSLGDTVPPGGSNRKR